VTQYSLSVHQYVSKLFNGLHRRNGAAWRKSIGSWRNGALCRAFSMEESAMRSSAEKGEISGESAATAAGNRLARKPTSGYSCNESWRPWLTVNRDREIRRRRGEGWAEGLAIRRDVLTARLGIWLAWRLIAAGVYSLSSAGVPAWQLAAAWPYPRLAGLCTASTLA